MPDEKRCPTMELPEVPEIEAEMTRLNLTASSVSTSVTSRGHGSVTLSYCLTCSYEGGESCCPNHPRAYTGLTNITISTDTTSSTNSSLPCRDECRLVCSPGPTLRVLKRMDYLTEQDVANFKPTCPSDAATAGPQSKRTRQQISASNKLSKPTGCACLVM